MLFASLQSKPTSYPKDYLLKHGWLKNRDSILIAIKAVHHEKGKAFFFSFLSQSCFVKIFLDHLIG